MKELIPEDSSVSAAVTSTKSYGPSLTEMTNRNLVNFKSGDDTLDWLRNRYREDDEQTEKLEKEISDEAAKNSLITVKIDNLNNVVKKDDPA